MGNGKKGGKGGKKGGKGGGCPVPPERQYNGHGLPYQTIPCTTAGSLCGNPNCGTTFICDADYNRHVQPLGYPGVHR
jgi:hypothetical protein